MVSLGNRSPMMIVTGLDPKLPITLAHKLPVEEVGVDEYVLELMKYLEETYGSMRAHGLELAQKTEGTQRGSSGKPLQVGHYVLRLKNEKDKPRGSRRFEERTDTFIYRIRHSIGENTFELEYLDGTLLLGFDGKPVRVSADVLIKLDMPELQDLGLDTMQPRMLELQDANDHHVWRRATLERVLPDATVVLRYAATPKNTHIVDLTRERYRWLYHATDDAAEP